LNKSEVACRKIRAATTESQVVAAVQDYVASLGAGDVAGLPLHALSACLVRTEESIHSALQLFEDAVGRAARDVPDRGTADDMRLVLTTAARRLAAISANAD